MFPPPDEQWSFLNASLHPSAISVHVIPLNSKKHPTTTQRAFQRWNGSPRTSLGSPRAFASHHALVFSLYDLLTNLILLPNITNTKVIADGLILPLRLDSLSFILVTYFGIVSSLPHRPQNPDQVISSFFLTPAHLPFFWPAYLIDASSFHTDAFFCAPGESKKRKDAVSGEDRSAEDRGALLQPRCAPSPSRLVFVNHLCCQSHTTGRHKT